MSNLGTTRMMGPSLAKMTGAVGKTVALALLMATPCAWCGSGWRNCSVCGRYYGAAIIGRRCDGPRWIHAPFRID
eukprot:200559-Pyramimonas_sp.AAC.1